MRRYDADLSDPLAVRRIPVTGPIPELAYLVTLDGTGERPNERETEVLALYVEYQRHVWFPTERAREKASTEPFDISESVFTTTLYKYAHGGWAYRRSSWVHGPFYRPLVGDEPVPLRDLLDGIHSDDGYMLGERWSLWKDAHRDVFG